jgi:hypothetical protein
MLDIMQIKRLLGDQPLVPAQKWLTFQLRNTSCILSALGTQHLHSPDHPNVKLIEAQWDNFLAMPHAPKIVLVEQQVIGNASIYTATKEEAVLRAGEKGLVTYLAQNFNIPVAGTEPRNIFDGSADFFNEFSLDEIAYYLWASQLYHFSMRGLPISSLAEYTHHALSWLQQFTVWQNFDLSVNHLTHIHYQYFKGEIDLTNPLFFKVITYTGFKNTVFNQLSTQVNLLRDVAMVQTTLSYLDQGYAVYLLLGEAHIYKQWQVYVHYFANNV